MGYYGVEKGIQPGFDFLFLSYRHVFSASGKETFTCAS
jgi:hypothetical protein